MFILYGDTFSSPAELLLINIISLMVEDTNKQFSKTRTLPSNILQHAIRYFPVFLIYHTENADHNMAYFSFSFQTIRNKLLSTHSKRFPLSTRVTPDLEVKPSSFINRTSAWSVTRLMGLLSTMSTPVAMNSRKSSSNTLPVTPTIRLPNPASRSTLVAVRPFFIKYAWQREIMITYLYYYYYYYFLLLLVVVVSIANTTITSSITTTTTIYHCYCYCYYTSYYNNYYYHRY